MQIGISSACFYPKVETENSILLMKELGFDLGEIFLNSPSEYEYDFVEKLHEQKLKHNFKINSVHAFCAPFEPFLFDRYERRRKDMLIYFRAMCKACKQLDANSYTFHGMRNIEFTGLDKDFVIDIYNELTYIANETGIKLAQENVSWCMSSNLDFLKMIKEKCKYPIFFTLDLKQAYKANKVPLEYINLMGKELVNLHINDKDEEHVCLLPGNGNIDYSILSKELSEIGYNGNAIIEVYNENFLTYDEIIKSKKLLMNVL
ncbi:MAG: sugar phosphate isomerase/epimerase [Clostridiaceae bacterium]|nr:sugar phosphate isomerase/epimerase [Clostridiaceae bacterium]